MFFGTHAKLQSTKDISVIHNGQHLEREYTVKYLGLKLDSKLISVNHVDYVRAKTIGKIKMLGRVSRVLNRDTTVTLYKTLILLIFDYCDYVYMYYMLNDRCKDVLQRLQNCALKNII